MPHTQSEYGNRGSDCEGLGLEFCGEEAPHPRALSFRRGGRQNFTPIHMLDYIDAVLNSPAYRETYKEFLKIDLPRVPFP